MFVRLDGTVRDRETNEKIITTELNSPMIVEVTEIDESRGWDYKLKTCVTGDSWLRNDGYYLNLLSPGNWVKLGNGQKVMVNSATATGFAYLVPDGSEKRVSYIDKDGKLTFVPCTTPKKWGETFQLEEFAHTYEHFSQQMHTYYENKCNEKWIYKNFIQYVHKKLGLINLLRKHPGWNETEKAVIVKRRITMNENVNEAANIMATFRYTHSISPRSVSDEIIYYMASSSYYEIPNDPTKPVTFKKWLIDRINIKLDKSIPYGTKATKVARMILTKHCDAGDFSDFEKIYAKYSDALTKRTKEVKYVVSANICDFVTMSHGNSWASCHSFKNHGGWHCGCLSYANDYVTLVTYAVEADAPDKDIYNQPKIFRNLFMLNEDQTEYIQSRVYPASALFNDVSCNELYNEVLAECGVIIDKAPLEDINRGSYKTAKGSLQYRDYDTYGYRYGGNTTTIEIGGPVYHLATGAQLLSASTMSDKYVGSYGNQKTYIIKTKRSRKMAVTKTAA